MKTKLIITGAPASTYQLVLWLDIFANAKQFKKYWVIKYPNKHTAKKIFRKAYTRMRENCPTSVRLSKNTLVFEGAKAIIK